MLGFGVFMQYATCLICADEIATGEPRQHLTGDYHTAASPASRRLVSP